MARSRNIKPSFFINDDLSEVDPLGRLLFIGLWTLADYKGDLEWRPRKVKAQVLPFDDCDIEELAINLDKSRFITFYSVSGNTYVRINNFTKHQNPHPNEKKKGSDIPEFTDESRQAFENNGVAINHDQSRSVSEHSITDPADSLLLIPDSQEKELSAPAAPPHSAHTTSGPKSSVAGACLQSATKASYSAGFEMIWPLFDNRREKKNAYAEYRKLKPDKQLAEAMRDALTREREHRQQAARLGVFVPEQKHPKRWLKAQCWNDELENLDEKPQRHGQGREPIDTTKPVSIDGI